MTNLLLKQKEIFMIHKNTNVSKNGNVTKYYDFFIKSDNGNRLYNVNYLFKDLHLSDRVNKNCEIGIHSFKNHKEYIEEKINKALNVDYIKVLTD